ncbi:MAG: hypothetical protein KatS3mg096_100 [Candidatus Parcubacteria bacterium]|nr:MAG: hypothetical protein KatS3mg096_100 [Candidatus Parcubacteria bacterium]
MAIVYHSFLSLFLPFIWIFYFYKKDRHPEPKIWLFLAFLLGIISAFLAYYVEGLLNPFVSENKFLKFLLFSFIEEFFKFILIWFFIFPQKIFDEPIDAMIYMMFAAWGFAFLENFVLITKPSSLAIYSPVSILFLRFLGANLLHILASALIGYGYAFLIKTRRIFPFVFSFATGSFLHFFYNYLIISLPPGFILVLPILWTAFLVVLSKLNYLAENG